jgi:hypothetical protein
MPGLLGELGMEMEGLDIQLRLLTMAESRRCALRPHCWAVPQQQPAGRRSGVPTHCSCLKRKGRDWDCGAQQAEMQMPAALRVPHLL